MSNFSGTPQSSRCLHFMCRCQHETARECPHRAILWFERKNSLVRRVGRAASTFTLRHRKLLFLSRRWRLAIAMWLQCHNAGAALNWQTEEPRGIRATFNIVPRIPGVAESPRTATITHTAIQQRKKLLNLFPVYCQRRAT